MALEEYNRKRDFRKTPEPSGRVRRQPAAEPLSFVVQKHAARRLHYDFRLELNGVLLSWAIPKGPSLDPGEKRLAVHVEDHPLDYGGFEGVIPKGQYGGGTVLLWDRGTWSPERPDPEAAYRKGALKFRLDGEKLHGHWALVRMGGRAAGERHENWLLIKERDEVAVPGSHAALVEDNPLSVATGRSMDEIAKDRDRVWDSEKGEIPGDRPAKTKPAKKPAFEPPAGARKRAMPDFITPQLATLMDEAPEGDQWLHEIKYDGYRILAHLERGKARLLTRNALDWTGKFPALARTMAALPVETAIIDGELVALAADGTTSFADLQDRIATGHTDDLVYFAFDLLYRDGYDLTGAVLDDRKVALAEIVPHDGTGMIRYSDHQHGRGAEFYRQACQYDLEGTIAKRADKAYRPGRGTDWQKIKCLNRDEFVIVGFTDPEGTRHGFGALLLGYYDPDGQLRYAGKVGTGFNSKKLSELKPRLDEIEQSKPSVTLPKGVSKKGVHWTKPRLVGEVQYGVWTADKILRHPSFQGLREDKSPEEVVYDPEKLGKPPAAGRPAPARQPGPARNGRAGRATPKAKAKPGTDQGRSRGSAKAKPQVSSPERKASIVPARDGSIEFAGVRLTHPDRVLYPDQGITKLALAEYYEAIADWALPHLANRPLSLVRCPEGQGKECFYQKHATPAVPKVVGRVEIPEGAGTGTGTYTYIKDLAGLIAMVQMGVLEIHPWGSTVKKLETPDIVTFDFDPDIGLPWERVTEAALEMRQALLGIGLQSFAKTTGGKGLHVVVPLTPKLDWEAIKEFAKWVAEKFVTTYPDRFTSNMAKRARTGRIFIDYLRNGRGATAIGAYSARSRPGAPVATPLFWDEVEKGVKPDGFTVATVPDRLKKLKSDPWAEIGKVRQTIGARVRKEIGI
ncbi:MAG: DNA ligase D [Alphaproteobacteria bacterium]|nr:DNA ligase D [Alphaproteobacteria bacterium]